MDLEKLRRDWREDPGLRFLAFDDVEALAEHLVQLHKTLMAPTAGPIGYLYRQQIRRLRELQQEVSRGP